MSETQKTRDDGLPSPGDVVTIRDASTGRIYEVRVDSVDADGKVKSTVLRVVSEGEGHSTGEVML